MAWVLETNIKGAIGPTGAPGTSGSPDTAAQVLAKLITVDGTGSGLDADRLDGQSSAYFLDRFNHTGTQAQSTVVNLVSDLAAKIGDAPSDNLQYARKNQAWAEVVAQNYGQLQNYMFNATTSTPPAAGTVRFNNATQNAVTTIWLNYTTNDAVAVNLKTYFINRIHTGDTFYFQDKDDITKWQLYELTSAYTDSGTYATLPVTWRAGASAITASRIIVSREGASVASPIGEAPNDGQQYGRQSQGWTLIPDEVAGGKITISSTAPSSPSVNDVWIDTT